MTRSKLSVPAALARKLGAQGLAIAIALGIWHLFASGPGDASGFPGPWDVAVAAVDQVGTSVFWSNVGNSVGTALMGLGLAVLIGLPLGLLIGSSQAAQRSTQLILDFFRTVPAIAFLPLFLLLFGATRSLGLVLIVFSAVWPVVIQTSYAVTQISQQLRRVGRAYHLSRWFTLRYVIVPSMLPFVFAGLRIAATISLLMAISSEFLGGSDGVGYAMLQAMQRVDNDTVFLYAVVAAVLGLMLNLAFVLLQRRLLWWHPSVRHGGDQ